ncbi:MAG: hypothetical protein KY453_10590, partial [Gemmatimonadetes bacterium]|nr:hypothetical protein [Gemmatimonadota bacterium]
RRRTGTRSCRSRPSGGRSTGTRPGGAAGAPARGPRRAPPARQLTAQRPGHTGAVDAAILAREAGIPTVVGLSGATERFAPGTVVRVDGASGEVAPVDEDES